MINVDLTQLALLAAVLTGVTELITRLRAKDMWVVLTIVSCGVVGALFGLSGYFQGLDWVGGLVFGFATSGFVKVATALGGTKSVAAPSNAVVK
jgi:hypothetical protein